MLRPRTEADLEDIWSYTATTWSEAQAIDYLSGLNAALAMLAEFPEIVRPRQEFTPPVRIHPYREHLVIYLVDSTTIDVLRLLYGRANWSAFLAE